MRTALIGNATTWAKVITFKEFPVPIDASTNTDIIKVSECEKWEIGKNDKKKG